MISPLARNIIALRERLRESQTVFGERFGVEQPTVSRWEKDVHRPDDRQIERMAELAGKSMPDFAYGHQSVVPLISWVSAGRLSERMAVEASQLNDFEPVPVAGLPEGDWFALKVDGDSMDRVAPDGSIILVNRRDRELVPGLCYILTVGDETAFKRYRDRPTRFEPYSTNPDHETIFPDEGARIIGRVKKAIVEL